MGSGPASTTIILAGWYNSLCIFAIFSSTQQTIYEHVVCNLESIRDCNILGFKTSYAQSINNQNMKSNKKAGRLVGLLFLLIFATGITVYQFLQGPVLFSDDFLTTTSANSNEIIISTLLLFLSGITSIVIAIILLPIFKNHNITLAFLYLAFSILSFIAISIDNVSVLSMLELSLEFTENGSDNPGMLTTIGSVFYKIHWWTHYLSLLTSCFPVFILYCTLYVSKLVPKVISIVGIIAVILMFIEILCSIFGNSISMNMLLPIGLIQLILPLWLIFKGLNSSTLETEMK